ncbi:MAG: EGF domain-containing protein [Polyangiaceae bacterium]
MRPLAPRFFPALLALTFTGLTGLTACDGGDGDSQGGSGGEGAQGGTGGQGAQGGTGGQGATGGGTPTINECQSGTAVCSPDADCVDTPGFYECVCKPGYEGDGKTCTDIDECQSLVHDCDPNAVCTNTPGAFSCACPAGFVGDGKTCSPRYSSVTTGPWHACAIRTDGTIWCWGFNSSGQVGTGTGDNYFVRPVSIGDATDWKQVTAGAAFTCALATTGKVSCWGTNSLGQLGDGTTAAKTSPVPAAGLIDDWVMIDAGTNHACGVRQDGSAWCWGRNNLSQLGDGSKDNDGDGTADNETLPVPVAGGYTWESISAGTDFTCGVQTDHTLWCWGTNGSRQLGNGTTAESVVPVQEKSAAADWAHVETGNAWACGVKLDGGRWCWGANNFAQGGNGTTTALTEPTHVDADTDWKFLRLGWDATSCGVRGSGAVHCWGDGSLGQTAQEGNESLFLLPVQVGADSDWKSLDVGQRFACGVRASGELFCWGATARGALASGFSGDRNEPAPLSDATDWELVESNVDNSCGLRGGNLYCWGRNVLENLGDGTGVSRPDPVPVGEGKIWKALSVAASSAAPSPTESSIAGAATISASSPTTWPSRTPPLPRSSPPPPTPLSGRRSRPARTAPAPSNRTRPCGAGAPTLSARSATAPAARAAPPGSTPPSRSSPPIPPTSSASP